MLTYHTRAAESLEKKHYSVSETAQQSSTGAFDCGYHVSKPLSAGNQSPMIHHFKASLIYRAND